MKTRVTAHPCPPDTHPVPPSAQLSVLPVPRRPCGSAHRELKKMVRACKSSGREGAGRWEFRTKALCRVWLPEQPQHSLPCRASRCKPWRRLTRHRGSAKLLGLGTRHSRGGPRDQPRRHRQRQGAPAGQPALRASSEQRQQSGSPAPSRTERATLSPR